MIDAGPYVNTDDLLARVFSAFKAFVAQLHASLVFTERVEGAATFDACGIPRQFALYFDMTMYCRHRSTMREAGTWDSKRESGNS